MFRFLTQALGIAALTLALTACPFTFSDGDRPAISPSSIQITQQREVSGFNRVVFSAFGTLIISQGASESLSIQTADNLMPLISANVSGGTLTIEAARGVRFSGFPQATLTLTVKDLSAISLDGVGAIQVQALQSPALTISERGAGSISLDQLATESLVIEQTGTGDLRLAGSATSQQLTLRGTGNYLAADLRSAQASVVLEGQGNATIWATESLDVRSSGAGKLSYWGAPALTQEKIGIGGVVSLGNK
jgi:Putative auto-transporter adhesin, head GIN domain